MTTLLVIGLLAAVVALAIRDIWIQRAHAIQHNFPVVGHLRYLMERIGPELRQYWVSNDKEELPFNRSERSWIYASAKNQNNTFGFGTSEQIYSIGYPVIKHATFPFPDDEATHPWDDATAIPCTKVMGESHGRKRPFHPRSIVNISAMSYGSLGQNAVSALNIGARESRAFHNTGEGGVSPYHLKGADLVWQLGTGYYGARDRNGRFSLDVLADRVAASPDI